MVNIKNAKVENITFLKSCNLKKFLNLVKEYKKQKYIKVAFIMLYVFRYVFLQLFFLFFSVSVMFYHCFFIYFLVELFYYVTWFFEILGGGTAYQLSRLQVSLHLFLFYPFLCITSVWELFAFICQFFCDCANKFNKLYYIITYFNTKMIVSMSSRSYISHRLDPFRSVYSAVIRTMSYLHPWGSIIYF